MRDFSILAFSITALVLGALIMLHQPNQPLRIPLAEVDEERILEPQPDLPPEPTAVAEPEQPPPNDSPVARIRIPGIGVDAKIVHMGVDAQGYMEVPSEPLEVAWYTFTSHPSFGSNAVFAGHVDSAKIGPAIFWRLRQVGQGDQIEVALSDGTTYGYKVISTTTFSSSDAPVEDIIGPTDAASITLITCDGTFNTRTHEYDKRLIVRAEMILPDAVSSSN
ncbi:MAG: sortase [Dehalococcoidia bacterium]|nr:sortase [Dehalococcoidia bacterium]